MIRDHDRPSVSVIIPVFNAEGTVHRAIDSVLAQTYSVMEVIVIDDGSNKPISPLLDCYGPNVRCIRQNNAGASAARNVGIRESNGDLVAFLDSDDFWEKDKIEQCVACFEDESVGIVATRYFVLDPGSGTVKTNGPEISDCGCAQQVSRKKTFGLAKRVSTPTVVVRRELLKKQNFDPSLATAEDRDLWVRLLRQTRCHLLEQPLTHVVLRGDSLSHHNVDQDCECMLLVICRHQRLIGFLAARREMAYVYYRWARDIEPARRSWRLLLSSFLMWPLPVRLTESSECCVRFRLAISLFRRQVWRAICIAVQSRMKVKTLTERT